MDDIEKQVIKLRKKGYSRNKISEMLHIGHTKTQKILEKYGLTAKQGFDVRKKKKLHKKRKKVISKTQKEKRVIRKNIKTAYYGFLKGRIQTGLFVEYVEAGTVWTNDLDTAVKMLFEKCEEFKRKYRFYVDYSSIVLVNYKVIKGKVKIINRETAIDMTKDIEYCLNFGKGGKL